MPGLRNSAGRPSRGERSNLSQVCLKLEVRARSCNGYGAQHHENRFGIVLDARVAVPSAVVGFDVHLSLAVLKVAVTGAEWGTIRNCILSHGSEVPKRVFSGASKESPLF